MDCVDELQRPIALPAPPRRIVSLVPSITETLFALGAGASVVGVSSFCTHPPQPVARLPKVGGTKNPDLEAILGLRPDVVILNEEENRREDFVWLEERGVCVYVTAPRTVRDGIAMIEGLGRLTGRAEDGQTLAHALRRQAECAGESSCLPDESDITIPLVAMHQPRLRVFCPIWRKPWMSFNAQTYSDDMLWTCGGDNIFRAKAERYPTVSLDEVAAADPQVVVLPSEPYPFAAKHLVHLRPLADTIAGTRGHVYCVDGRALCWYGPRIADGLAQFRRLFATVRASLDVI